MLKEEYGQYLLTAKEYQERYNKGLGPKDIAIELNEKYKLGITPQIVSHDAISKGVRCRRPHKRKVKIISYDKDKNMNTIIQDTLEHLNSIQDKKVRNTLTKEALKYFYHNIA